MFEKILVPLSGSASAEAAVPYATEIAAKNDSELILAHVNAPEKLRSLRSYLEGVRVLAERQLSDFSIKTRATVRTDLLTGEPIEGIQRYAGANGCDLIIMASHGRRGVEGLVLGNETQKVLTHSKIPVLVYR